MTKILMWVCWMLLATSCITLLQCILPNNSPFFVIGQGVFASALVIFMLELVQEIRLYNRLHHLHGEWEEMDVKSRFLASKLGEGRIVYRGGNSALISLSHDFKATHTRTWRGEAIFDRRFPHIGSIAWAYDSDSYGDHEFGLKEIIIPQDNPNKSDRFIYLIPVNHLVNLGGIVKPDGRVSLASKNYNIVVWRKKR